MTSLLFDTITMDQTAQMISDAASEYDALATQLLADADLGAMPPQLSAFVDSELGSISQTLRDSAWSLSSDARLLAWRSEAARLADDPSLGAIAEMLFGGGATVGSLGLFEDLVGSDIGGGADPLLSLAGCACSLGGYGVVTYDPTTEAGWVGETATSAAWGEGTYQSTYVGESGDVIEIPIEPIDLGTSDSSTSIEFSMPMWDPGVGSTSDGSTLITFADPLYVDPSDPNVIMMTIPDPVIYPGVPSAAGDVSWRWVGGSMTNYPNPLTTPSAYFDDVINEISLGQHSS